LNQLTGKSSTRFFKDIYFVVGNGVFVVATKLNYYTKFIRVLLFST